MKKKPINMTDRLRKISYEKVCKSINRLHTHKRTARYYGVTIGTLRYFLRFHADNSKSKKNKKAKYCEQKKPVIVKCKKSLRPCMCCRKDFLSEGIQNRLCKKCKKEK